MCLFVNATVLSDPHTFSLKWFSVLKTLANVDLEPTYLGLRVPCSTD